MESGDIFKFQPIIVSLISSLMLLGTAFLSVADSPYWLLNKWTWQTHAVWTVRTSGQNQTDCAKAMVHYAGGEHSSSQGASGSRSCQQFPSRDLGIKYSSATSLLRAQPKAGGVSIGDIVIYSSDSSSESGADIS